MANFGTLLLSILVLAFGLVAVRSDFYVTNDNCPDLSQALGKGCTINDDCTKITCEVDGIGNKKTTLIVKINKCDEPVTVDVTVKVPDLLIDWTHNFPSDAVVAVPGFSISGFAGVYVKVVLTDTGINLRLTIRLLAGSKFLDSYPINIKIVESDLPITTYECGIIRWWKNLGIVLQIVVGASPIVVLILLFVCCYCCCCRTRPQGPGVVVMAPAPSAFISTTNSNVPMSKFENEVVY